MFLRLYPMSDLTTALWSGWIVPTLQMRTCKFRGLEATIAMTTHSVTESGFTRRCSGLKPGTAPTIDLAAPSLGVQ